MKNTPPPFNEYTRRLSNTRLAIFLFHGVVPRHRHRLRNYTRKHIDRNRFRDFLDAVLRAGGRPLSLDEALVHRAQKRPFPKKSFVVTFDDGFANNATVAAPCLDERKIPAVFYLTTGFVGKAAGSWTDALEAAAEERARFSLAWPAFGIDGVFETVQDKIGLLESLRARIKSDPAVDPYAAANEFQKKLGVRALPPDPDLDLKMSWAQARALDAHPLFALGGHGHTHRILSFLSPTALFREIRTSVSILNTRLRRPLDHYSYPEGLAHCFNPRVIRALRAAGVRCCPTALPGTNPVAFDPFRLRRIPVV